MKKLIQEFHPLTVEYLQSKDIKYRRINGQYFTPAKVRDILFKRLKKYDKNNILDPACGTGEFLLSASEYYPEANIYGWEKDRYLSEIAKKINPNALISNIDSLKENLTPKFDLVIGNPPYFEFQPENEIREKYKEVIKGRTNIFSFFIKLGLDLLVKGGHLAFVVPPSMNNGAFFNKLREYIIDQGDIEYLKILNSPKLFDQAQQSVMLIIIKKDTKSRKYIFERNGLTLFSPNASILNRYFKSESTLFEQGFRVKTGPVVWNENRSKLTNSDKNSILLIWGHNIKKGKIVLNLNSKKCQFIKTDKFLTGPAILVNRITGTSVTSKLKAALIKSGQKFLAENHVNIIFPPQNSSQFDLDNIVIQLNSQEISDKLKLITGNTQLSKNELEKVLPLKF